MKISTKGRYALCVMLDLAEHRQDGYIALKDIAARQNISKKYLEQIVALLNRPEILKTVRGAQGGYMLANLDDPAEAAAAADAQLLPIWQGLYTVVNDYLEGITLQDILDRRMESYDYSI